MVKIYNLQFVRTLFIVVTLLGFNASNLFGCVCAAKRLKNTGDSCCAQVQKEHVSSCCKKVAAKSAEKCCKKMRCIAGFRQDTAIESNHIETAFAVISALRSYHLTLAVIPEPPIYSVAFGTPSAEKLCVFLC